MEIYMKLPPRSPDDVADWENLQIDLLNEISRRLNFDDYVSFRLTCKKWNEAPSTSVFSTFNSPSSVVLIFDEKDGSCFIYNFSEASVDHQHGNLQCTILNLPELVNSAVISSCNGWLLVRNMNRRRVCLLNPFRSTPAVDLPPFSHYMMDVKRVFWYGLFLGTPSDDRFAIQIASNWREPIIVTRWVPGDNQWHCQKIQLIDHHYHERLLPDISWCSRSKITNHDFVGKLINVLKQFVRDTRKDDDDEIDDVMMKKIDEKRGAFTVNFSGGLLPTESLGMTSGKLKLGIFPGDYCCMFSHDGRVEIRRRRKHDTSFGSVKAVVVEAGVSKFSPQSLSDLVLCFYSFPPNRSS